MTIDQFVSMMRRPSFYFGCSCSCSLVVVWNCDILGEGDGGFVCCSPPKMRFLVRFADVDTAMFTCVSVRVNRKFEEDVKVM